MTEALELRETAVPVALSSDQLNFISRTEFVPQGLRGNLPAILACVTTGRELGLGDMTSLRSIHIIDGKATFSAELMVQLVRKAGHSITGDVSAEQATVVGKRNDNGDTMTVTWTLAMADRAGLTGKSNWKKYPETMLWARAVSQLCRMLFADCFAGASYTPEELGAGDVTANELQDEPVRLPEALVDENPDGLSFIASPKQQLLVLARANEAGLDDDARHALLERVTGNPSTKSLMAEEVDRVLSEIAALDTRGGAAPRADGGLPGAAIVPSGTYANSTLSEVAASEGGIGWLAARLKKKDGDPDVLDAIFAYVQAEQPTLWDGYQRWLEEQT